MNQQQTFSGQPLTRRYPNLQIQQGPLQYQPQQLNVQQRMQAQSQQDGWQARTTVQMG